MCFFIIALIALVEFASNLSVSPARLQVQVVKTFILPGHCRAPMPSSVPGSDDKYSVTFVEQIDEIVMWVG